MSDHSHDSGHTTVATTDDHGHAVAAAGDHRFEKDELHYFDAEDRGAGQGIGILLACFFCVLLSLMVGVTIWTSIHHSQGDDPFGNPAKSAVGHH